MFQSRSTVELCFLLFKISVYPKTVPFTFVLYSQINAFMFSRQFWAAAALFEPSSPSMLPVFTKYIPAFYGAMTLWLWKTHRKYLFVLICERFRNNRALSPLQSENLSQYSFWHFVEIQLIVWPGFCTHFTDILNSQLMYAVQLLMIKGGLTLIL